MLFLDEESVRNVEHEIQRWVDLWPAGGPGPLGAEAVSTAVALGVAAYDRLTALEDRIVEGIRAADGKVVYDYGSAKEVERLTKLWLAPVGRAYDAVTAVRRAGGHVDAVDALIDRVDDAEVGTSISVERAMEIVEQGAREDPELFRANLRWPTHAV
jgi:hypothetical protein